MSPVRVPILLFLIGAVVGTALDHLHVASGATSYAHPFLFRQAAWVPLLFGFAGAGFADLHGRLRKLFQAELKKPSPEAIAADGAVFVLAYVASAYLRAPNWTLLALFAATFAFRMRKGPLHGVVH